MALNVIPEAQPAYDGLGGADAQASIADYRLSVIHDQTVSSLSQIRWLQFGSGAVASVFVMITFSLIIDFDALTLVPLVFFATSMLFLLRAAANECREVLTTVNALEYMKDSQRREIDKMNVGLVRLHQRNLFLEQKLAAAGGADGTGGNVPSASNLRFIPHRGRVQ